jgi:hypothetical protein
VEGVALDSKKMGEGNKLRGKKLLGKKEKRRGRK